VAGALLDRAIGVDAGIYSGTSAPDAFSRFGRHNQVQRVLAEVTDTDAGTATASAAALLEAIGPGWAGNVLLHGEEGSAWPVLAFAARLHCDTRIGLEDVLTLPDGTTPRSNADLVTAALSILRWS
jgi:beta-keto acid cleavage enzyme